jgi:hypothetical protein
MGRAAIHQAGFTAAVLGALVAATLVACSSNGGDLGPPSSVGACTSAPPFTVTPVAISDIQWVGPLGNLSPSGHVFPSNHTGIQTQFNPGAGTTVAPVVAPGNITIVQMVSQTSVRGTTTFHDYSMTFYPCSNMMMYFGHVSSLSASLTSQVGDFGSCDPTYVTGGVTVTLCRKDVNISLAAGETIGTLGGANEGAMDFGGSDTRTPALGYADPNRFPGSGDNSQQLHVICPIDYFTPAVRDQLRLHFGGGRTNSQRTVEPLCGAVMQDVPGAAQGRWFFDNTDLEDHHLALVHDQINPGMPVFSVGTSIATLPTNVYYFTAATTGRVNLDFNHVTSDGNIYCYEWTQPTPTRVLLQLTTSTHLKIEASTAPSGCGDPVTWAFSAAVTEFDR